MEIVYTTSTFLEIDTEQPHRASAILEFVSQRRNETGNTSSFAFNFRSRGMESLLKIIVH